MTGKMKLYGMDRVLDGFASPANPKESGSALDWMHATTILPIGFLAGLTMGVVDWFLASPQNQRSLALAASALHGSGVGTLLALVLILVIWPVGKILKNVRRRRLTLTIFLILGAGALLGLFLPPLLAMPGVEPDRRLTFRVALVGTILLLTSVASLYAVRQVLLAPAKKSNFALIANSTIFFVIGLALQWVDSRLYVGGYPQAHTLAAIFSGACYGLFFTGMFATLEEKVPNHALRNILAASAIFVLTLGFHCWIRGRNEIHTLREEILRPSFTVTHKTLPLLEEHLLKRWAPLAPLIVQDAYDVVASALNPKIDQSAIDARLPKNRTDWNLVIITADTLRFDEVGWSAARQHKKSITPNIDKLAKNSIRLTNARTPYPTSNYAYSSLLSGYYPRFSPARRPYNPKGNHFQGKLLTEVLRDAGRATWAVTAFNKAGINTESLFGHIRPGFDVVNPLDNNQKLDAREITSSALTLINERDKKRPFFLWAHYMDAHAVYREHEDARFQFGKDPRSLYRGEIAYLDHRLSPLLQRLAEDDLHSKTVILFISDHGESFGEHDTTFHNSNLHNEQIHVPGFIHIPTIPGDSRHELFNLVDVTPTLLSILGIADPEKRQGRNFAQVLLAPDPNNNWIDFSYSERFPRDAQPGRKEERSLIFKGGKIIRFASDSSARHYDLNDDPQELTNNFNPASVLQQEQLGFLVSLQKELELFFGAPTDSNRNVGAEFDKWLEKLNDQDLSDDFKCIVSLAKILFDNSHNYRADLDELLGADRITRLHETLLRVTRSALHPQTVCLACFDFLLALPHQRLSRFMKEGLQSPSPQVRQSTALWLLKRGDRTGIDIVNASLNDYLGEWNLLIAPWIVQAGHINLAPWILPNLDRPNSKIVARSLSALATIGFNDLDLVLRGALSSPGAGLNQPRAQLAVAEVASKLTGKNANALLARMAHTNVPEARRLAREALGMRVTPALQEQLLLAASQEILADESTREKRYAEAIPRLLDAISTSKMAGIKDLFAATKLVHLYRLVDNKKNALKTLQDILLTENHARPWVKAWARSLEKLCGQELIKAGEIHRLQLVGEIADKAKQLPGKRNTFFAREVTLRNEGPGEIGGGVWHWGNRVTWIFKNADTEAWLLPNSTRRLPGRFLPASGLGSKGSIKVLTIGRTPSRPGRWIPVLVLSREPWFSLDHKILLQLPVISY